MDVSPIVLEGAHVRLEPLERRHEAPLVAAAADGELWNSRVTIVPSAATISAYVDAALQAQEAGRELPFVMVRRSTGVVSGTTRFRNIDRTHRRMEIGSTWLSASAQRSPLNTEAKLLLMAHAFEKLGCIRMEFVTDVLNEQSRKSILRLGAKEEGVLRNHMIMPGGRHRDSACYSIIDTEWPQVRAGLEERLRANEKAGA